MNEKIFVDSFFFRFNLCLNFSLLSAFLYFKPFEIIRWIVKLLIATWIYYMLKYNWKKKTWKVFFGRPNRYTGLPNGPNTSRILMTAVLDSARTIRPFWTFATTINISTLMQHGHFLQQAIGNLPATELTPLSNERCFVPVCRDLLIIKSWFFV